MSHFLLQKQNVLFHVLDFDQEHFCTKLVTETKRGNLYKDDT